MGTVGAGVRAHSDAVRRDGSYIYEEFMATGGYGRGRGRGRGQSGPGRAGVWVQRISYRQLMPYQQLM